MERSCFTPSDRSTYSTLPLTASLPITTRIGIPIRSEYRRISPGLATPNALPLTFLLLHNDRIMGFFLLIEQESLMQKDLSPWIAPLFIDESLLGRGLGAALLLHARRTAGRIGYSKVYLTTDHIGYYEKHGFR
ncbi:MAG: hypothetical protein K0Q63_3272, partial [Paenibacillus sp.]|nr:hypothetical protein [Paenibacillus sp.]